MKILVCGGRNYADEAYLVSFLDDLNEDVSIDCLVQGAARGADRLAAKWAEGMGIKVRSYPADWDTLGKSAGPIRNQKMLDQEHPELVVAFPGGAGTLDMVNKAKKAKIAILNAVVKIPGE